MSKTAPANQFINNSNYGYLYDPYNNAKVKIGARYYHYLGSDHVYGNTVILHYIPDLDTWELSLPFQADSRVGDDILIGYESTYTYSSSDVEKKTIYTNGWTPSKVNGYLTFIVKTKLPSNIPEINIGMPDIQAELNNALNATTSVTTQAITINNNINNTYNSYKSGGITQAEFDNAMEQYRTQLETLANNSNATLADQMAVNNALTNLDITINQQVNNVSPALMTLLNDIRSQISGFFNSYRNGNSTQSAAVNNIKNTINENLLKVTSQYTSIADRTAINGTVEYANQLINAIGSFSDLDSNTSESVQTSDSEELEYLDSAIAETTKDISDLKSDIDDVISDSDAQQIKTNVLEPILDNLLVKSILPIAALFMVLAVTLGVRYRL